MKRFFWVLVAGTILLGYCGAQPADAMVGGVPIVWVARLATLYYFAFFWLIMPIVGLVEVPDELPASISQSEQVLEASTHTSRLAPKRTGNAIRSTVGIQSTNHAWPMTRRRRP
jgi:ubiquinol-cytochrome c reductase cytochrome b subunit